MCGFAGIARAGGRRVDPQQLLRMAAVIRHRGPDGYGVYTSSGVGFSHVRLSIIDLERGAQPLVSADGRLVIAYNGEVYNYLELRDELEGKGHRFRTTSDTEVVLAAFAEWGRDALHRFNGQFAFAIHDRWDGSVFLARDRFGVRPLFYAQRGRDVLFASEVKALLASSEVDARPDLRGLDQIFTFWGSIPPRTVFEGISQIEPGGYAVVRDGTVSIGRYYRLSYPGTATPPADALATLEDLMQSAVRLRMRADVPVGGYLSGGLDSSITCTLAAGVSPHRLRTFSVTFDDPALNEAEYQLAVARDVGSLHAVQPIGVGEIAAVFPDVIWHTETPVLRTAPAPLFLLSKLTRESDIKVVLTGEGADELFLGYDLFKEAAVRMFCLRRPDSRIRPRLFDRLYPYLERSSTGQALWRQFFLSAGGLDSPLFSHMPRIRLAGWSKQFYSPEVRQTLAAYDAGDEFTTALPAEFADWSPLHRAAYLEIVTLLSPYLLCSQGDRMAMAHSVEGRFPFLDHRIFEFAAALPETNKLLGLKEKHILKRWAAQHVSPRVRERHKQPYRAPDIPAFFGGSRQAYVDELLDTTAVRDAGLFNPDAVEALAKRCRSGRAMGTRENQALVGVLSAQLWHRSFVGERRRTEALGPDEADVYILDENAVSQPER
jgi:asparagine synthase (glutamine-hydrolysing)